MKKKEHLSPYQAEHVVHAMPNPLEFFSFIFCTGTLLSGPYFEFSEFKDFMEHKGVSEAGLYAFSCGHGSRRVQQLVFSKGGGEYEDFMEHKGVSGRFFLF